MPLDAHHSATPTVAALQQVRDQLDRANEQLAMELKQATAAVGRSALRTSLRTRIDNVMAQPRGSGMRKGLALLATVPHVTSMLGNTPEGILASERIGSLRQKVVELGTEISRSQNTLRSPNAAVRAEKAFAKAEGSFGEDKPGACLQCQSAPPTRPPAPERLQQHQKAIDAHRAKYLRKVREARTPGQKKAYKARVTEAKGEQAATAYMRQHHPDYELVSGFAVDTGFDQIWVKRKPNGQLQEILIVEAKGPHQSLKTGAEKGKQMSTEWVKNTAAEWIESPSSNPATVQVAVEIHRALQDKDGKPPVRGAVIRAVETKGSRSLGSELLPCPNDGKYN